MTRCDALDELLPLHATGDTSVEEALQVEEHLQGCATCREDLAFYVRLAATAREDLAAAPDVPEEMIPKDAQSSLATRKIPAVWRPRPRPAAAAAMWPLGGWRLAAAVVLMVTGLAAGVAIGRWSATDRSTPHEVPAAVAPGILPAAAVQARGLPLSVFSPAARARLSKVAQADSSAAP